MVRFNSISFWYSSKYQVKIFFIVFSVVVAALVVDTSLVRLYSFSTLSNQSFPNSTLIVFLATGAVYSVGQYLILGFVKSQSKESRPSHELHLRTVHKIVALVQSVLIVVFVSLALEMILMSEYDTSLLAMASGISYALTITMMALLAKRFFSWFKSNRDSVVLFYGLSSGMVAVNAAFTVAFVDVILSGSPQHIYQHVGAPIAPFIIPGSAADLLNPPFVVSSILSFIFWWAATVLLLHGYSKKLGRPKYWIIVSIPLAYFLSQFLPLYPSLFAALPLPQYIGFLTYELIFALSKSAGGILFGVAFWILARSLGDRRIVRGYITISAYGLVLLFVSNQAIAFVNNAYPPFGLATVSFMGLSAYLVLLGIYSAALSVAEDSKLRQSIRNFAMNESKLLDNIGTAEMQHEIEKKVIALTKQNQDRLTEETGIQSSLTEEDMKEYLEQVVDEVKKGHRDES